MPTETPSVRIKLIDYIGFVSEIKKQYADKQSDTVKDTMNRKCKLIKKDSDDNGVRRAEADYFEALLIPEGTSLVIDPAKFLNLYESGKMKRAEFLSAISVSTTDAREFMAAKDVEKISDEKDTSESLRITRRKEVPLELVDAYKGIADEIIAKQPAAA